MRSDFIQKTLLGQYRVDQHIASTGLSDVYRVWDIKRHVYLAMKVLNTDLAEDPAMVKRFNREAQALKKLNHPHIVPFYGLFEEEDTLFLLELFIDGPNLKDILRKLPEHKMSIGDALIFLKAVSAALGYAHANGVVHCDIKPGNVMVDQGGTIYLTDFGIARHADSSTTTMVGAGTAAYMAPEQIRGESVSPATDVYALGCMLYEMLTGRRPFRGDDSQLESSGVSTSERLRYAHLHMSPPDPQSLRPDLSASVTAVIMKSLNKKPEERFQSAVDFFAAVSHAAALEPFQITERYDLGFLRPSTYSSPIPQQSFPLALKSPVKRKLPIWTFPVLGVSLLLILGYVFISKNGGFDLLLSKKDQTSLRGTPNHMTGVIVTSTPASVRQPTVRQIPTVSTAPKPVRTNLIGRDGQILVYIPEGEFTMGLTDDQIDYICNIDPECDRDLFRDSKPAHQVSLSEYYIYKTEVTNSQYSVCVEDNGCTQPVEYRSHIYDDYYYNPLYKDYPVVNVTWDQADKYCKWAGGRLPTEAEWEKAARGTKGYIWPWGNQPPADNLANLSSTNLTTIDNTTPVGYFPDGASPYGLLDMAGNVYEWIADWYSPTYYAEAPPLSINPRGPETPGRFKVVRGGSSGFGSYAAVSGLHDREDPQSHGFALGFRCVQDVNQSNIGLPIKIAILAPLSGPVPLFGAMTRDGALLAIEEWNAKVGVAGVQIIPIVEDSQCTPDPAVAAANKVIEQDVVKFIIGEVCSRASIPISDIANSKGVIQISPTSTDPDVTFDPITGQTKQYIFRTCFIDSFQGQVGAKFAIDELGAKTAFVLFDPANNYVEDLAVEFIQTYEKMGGKILGKETYKVTDADFSAILSKVADVKPDVVYLPDYYNIVNLVTRQAKLMGITTPFIGGDGWDSADLDLSAAAGSYFTNHYTPDDPSPAVTNFREAFFEKYGTEPDALAALAYDSTNLLLTAIDDAGTTDTRLVAEKLARVTFTGVTGELRFDNKHNPIKSAIVLSVERNGVSFKTHIDP